jgi:hypothetical protein
MVLMEFFIDIIPPAATRPLASNQPLTEVGTGNISWGGKGGRCVEPHQPRPTALLPPRSNGKQEAAIAVDELLMMDMRMPETC